MIKILHIVSTLEKSGPNNIIYNLIKYSDSTKFQTFILTLSPEPVNSKKDEFLALGVTIIELKSSRLRALFTGIGKVKKVLKDLKPDIIHTHSYRSDILSSNLSGYCRRVATIHGNLINAYVNSYGLILGKIMALHELRSLNKIEVPIACSESIKIWAGKFINSCYVIQNGVDEEVYKPLHFSEKQTLKSELGIPLDKKVFISVGSLSALKDPDTIIRAFKKIES